jgi:hypothetical protein
MKIRGLLLAGLMLGVSSFAYLKVYAGGSKSASPPAAGQLFSKPVRASSLTTNSGTRNGETLDVAAAHKEASAGAAHADATCTGGSVASGVYANLNIAGTSSPERARVIRAGCASLSPQRSARVRG